MRPPHHMWNTCALIVKVKTECLNIDILLPILLSIIDFIYTFIHLVLHNLDV